MGIVRGDLMVAISEMGRLERVLTALDTLPRRVAVEAAPRISRLLRRQFAAGVDPYGRRWARLSEATLAKGRHPPPLTDSGKLSDGTRAATMVGGRAGLRIILGKQYAYFHQVGTKNMPARKILPERGMPRPWREAIDKAARAAFRKTMAQR